MYPTLPTPFVRGTIYLLVPWHVAKTLTAPVVCVFRLVDTGDIVGHCGFPKHIETPKDAFIGEVESTVAVATVLLGDFLQQALLGDMPLFVTVIAEAIVASASKKRTLDWASTAWSQWHPIFYSGRHWSVSDVSISYLLQCLHLFHPPLYSTHLHI